MIIIAFKSAQFEIFFHNLLAAPRTVSDTYTQVAKAQSCENHVQHIERLSRAAEGFAQTAVEKGLELMACC